MAVDAQSDPKTILVVDDDISVLTVIKCMLESGDYNVLLANNADVALRMAERDDLSIDLMLTDVMMPDVSGPDLAKQVQAICPQMKVLFMSGYADSEVVRVKVLDHALGFLPKPFTSDSLLETVKRAIIAPRSLSAVVGRRPQ
jgi:DNA-binding NtrC family response regulator